MEPPLLSIATWPRRTGPVAVLLLGAIVAGCSSTTLSAGSALGNAGKTAATTRPELTKRPLWYT
jgi:hypothetical protein